MNQPNLKIKTPLKHLKRKLKKRRMPKIRIQFLVRTKKKKRPEQMSKNLHKLVIELLR